MQRQLTVTFLLLAIFVLSACSKSQAQSGILIEFKDGAYNPQNITVKVGQTITFSNKSEDLIWPASNIHPTHQIYPQFDPKKPIKAGDSWNFTFDKAGIWKFHDHINPQITGEINVE